MCALKTAFTRAITTPRPPTLAFSPPGLKSRLSSVHMDIQALRREYASRSSDESAIARDPLEQFRIWFDEALRAEVFDVNAMALATVSDDGTPSARTVLLKDIDERGLVFFTHYNSPKGHD